MWVSWYHLGAGSEHSSSLVFPLCLDISLYSTPTTPLSVGEDKTGGENAVGQSRKLGSVCKSGHMLCPQPVVTLGVKSCVSLSASIYFRLRRT